MTRSAWPKPFTARPLFSSKKPWPARLSAREEPLIENLKEYFRGDPSSGRIAIALRFESINHYRDVVRNLAEISLRVSAVKPGRLAAILAWFATLPARVRSTLMRLSFRWRGR